MSLDRNDEPGILPLLQVPRDMRFDNLSALARAALGESGSQSQEFAAPRALPLPAMSQTVKPADYMGPDLRNMYQLPPMRSHE